MTDIQVEKLESDNGIILIKRQQTRLIADQYRIFHKINLTDYYNTLMALSQIQVKISDNGYKFITEYFSDLKPQINDLLTKITLLQRIDNIDPEKAHNIYNFNFNRTRRGLVDPIGGLYKFLFGVMDNDDREEILEHLEVVDKNEKKLASQLNKQIKNNDIFERNLELLKNRTVHIQDQLKQFSTWTTNQLNNVNLQIYYLKYKITLFDLTYEIDKIIDNVNAARFKIMSRSILDRIEVEQNSIGFYELQELSISIFAKSGENILYIVFNIPIFYKAPVFTYYLRTIPINNCTKLDIPNQIVIRFKDQYYPESKYVKELKTPINCEHTCKLIKVSNITSIEEIEKGILFVENFIGEVKHNCNEKPFKINGNFVINFNNCSVYLNQKLYTNRIVQFEHKLIMSAPIFLNYTKHEVTFEDIKLENSEKLEEIKLIDFNHKRNMLISSISTVVFIIVILVLIYFYFKLKSKTVNVNVNASAEKLAKKFDKLEKKRIKYENRKSQILLNQEVQSNGGGVTATPCTIPHDVTHK